MTQIRYDTNPKALGRNIVNCGTTISTRSSKNRAARYGNIAIATFSSRTLAIAQAVKNAIPSGSMTDPKTQYLQPTGS